jgi:hypothetical protein
MTSGPLNAENHGCAENKPLRVTAELETSDLGLVPVSR